MDIEYLLPLLTWVSSATSTELRKAVQICTNAQAKIQLEQAIVQTVKMIVPEKKKKERRDGMDTEGHGGEEEKIEGEKDTKEKKDSDLSSISTLPPSLQPHITRFINDTVENLSQLTSYLLTEQISSSAFASDDGDGASSGSSHHLLRTHVTQLINSGNRAFLLLLHDEFVKTPQKNKMKEEHVPISVLLKQAQMNAANPTITASAASSASSSSSSSSSLSTSFTSAIPTVASPAASSPQLPSSTASNTAASSSSFPSSSSSSIASSASFNAPLSRVSLIRAPSAFPTSSDSEKAVTTALAPTFTSSSFLHPSSSHLDILCHLLSYLNCFELLSSVSHVSQRWFRASCDPRCFRQISQLRVTQFMMPPPPPTVSAATNEWAWNTQPAAAPAPLTYTPPTAKDYSSFTRMLTKLSRLHKLDLAPRCTNQTLEAIGKGEGMMQEEPQAYLSELRTLQMRNAEDVTDAGLKSLVAGCECKHENFLTSSGTGPSSLPSSSPPQLSSPPPCFLHRLLILDLSGCRRLTDSSLCALLSHTPNLRHVDFSYLSSLGLAAMNVLARVCRKVTRLNLAGTRGVNDDWLKVIGGSGNDGLLHLRMLSIEDCWSVSSTGITYLTNRCLELHELNMSGTYNAVTEQAFDALVMKEKTRNSISVLNFTGCPMTDSSIHVLMHGSGGSNSSSKSGGLQNLISLSISTFGRMGTSSSELSDASLQSITSSRAALTLQFLDVTGCTALTDQAVKMISNGCKALRTLVMSRCASLSDASLQSLSSSPLSSLLQSLDVSHIYQLTDACLPSLLKLTRLQELKMKKCLRVSDVLLGGVGRPKRVKRIAKKDDEVTTTLIASLPLQSLDLSGCKITDSGALQLQFAWRRSVSQSNLDSSTSSSSYLRDLHTLSLSECHLLTDEGLSYLLPLTSHLTSLSLVGCHRLTNQSLYTIAMHCRQLRTILLHQCVELSNEGVIHMFERLPFLYEVGLDEVTQLSNAALLSISRHLPHVRHLSFAHLPHITYHSLHAIVAACSHLRTLNCSRAQQITGLTQQHQDRAWQDLLQKCARRGIQFLR